MFDSIKNLASIPGLMSKAKEMQERMKTVQEDVARRQVSAGAGENRVEATVSGAMQLLEIHIDKSRLNVQDTDLLEDLIVAAVNAAQAKAAQMMQSEMQKVTAELGLPPGMSF